MCSSDLDSLGRVMYHEFLHHDKINQPGPDDKGGPKEDDVIADQINKDDLVAYLPERTHGLIDKDQDERPDLAPWNADSYAWLATVSSSPQHLELFGIETDPIRRMPTSSTSALRMVPSRQTMATTMSLPNIRVSLADSSPCCYHEY